MKKILPLVLLLASSAVIAQTKYIYYFDLDFNLCKKSQSVYYGNGSFENGLFELKVYTRNSDALRILQHFKDSSLQESDGLFVSYSYDNIKESEGNYVRGEKDGIWKRWNSSGQILDSSVYQLGEKIFETHFSYDPKQKLIQAIVDSIEKGSNKIVYFDSKGNVLASNHSLYSVDSAIVYRKPTVSATFPGGTMEWLRYIRNKIELNIDKFGKADYGTCLLQFIVDTNGNVSNVKAVTLSDSRLAKVAIDAILNGPKWIPGRMDGRNVDSYRIQPITLQKPDE